jgi:hypothetical protein
VAVIERSVTAAPVTAAVPVSAARQAATRRRLLDVEPSGGAGQAPGLGHRQEVAQMSKFHLHNISYISLAYI